MQDPVTLASGPVRLTVDPGAGGRLASLRVADLPLLVELQAGADPLWWGAYPMVPWAGRLGLGRLRWEGHSYQLERTLPPHAIHGVGWLQAWVVEDAADDHCRLACDLGPAWPFGGRAVHLIEIDPGGLRLTLEVHAGDVPMPAACGWHPWWRRDLPVGGALEVELAIGERWEKGSDGLPTGALVPAGDRPPEGWDDCFTAEGSQVLRWPGAAEVTVESDCAQLVVYDTPVEAICVEPQTAPPDAINLGRAARVEPGAPLVAHTAWSWTLG